MIAELLGHPAHLWLIAGAALVCFEIFALPGIGLVFAGLGALATGLLVQFGFVDSLIAQWAAFFIVTCLWAVLLWRPLQRFLKKSSSGQTYQNMVGTKAMVLAPGLEKGKKGTVRWSGTQMNAVLADDAPDALVEGTEVEILSVQGNVLTVR